MNPSAWHLAKTYLREEVKYRRERDGDGDMFRVVALVKVQKRMMMILRNQKSKPWLYKERLRKGWSSKMSEQVCKTCQRAGAVSGKQRMCSVLGTLVPDQINGVPFGCSAYQAKTGPKAKAHATTV